MERHPNGLTATMTSPGVLLLTAVYLPPRALDELGLLVEERTVHTRHGDVGPIAFRRSADGVSTWVQPYFGLPMRTDPRATMLAAKALGVQRVLMWDIGAGINHAYRRGQTVIAVDLIDRTRHQPATFHDSPEFEDLPPASEETATFCPECTEILRETYYTAPPAVVVGTDGPRRETPAEAAMIRTWGGDVICHNIVPEAFLARELGLCFGAVVTVNSYSHDQYRESVEGEVRAGLEYTMQRMPSVLRRMSEPVTCRCRA